MFASVEAQTKLPCVPKYVIRLSNNKLASIMVNCPFFFFFISTLKPGVNIAHKDS